MQYEGRIMVVMARFFCGILLHIGLMDEFRVGMNLMKYVLNHSYRFEEWGTAYCACLFKVVAIVTTEVVCILVVCISIAPMAIVYNFIALAIIADFDNYIFESYIEVLKCLFEVEECHE